MLKWSGGNGSTLSNEGRPFRGNLLRGTKGKAGIDEFLKVLEVRPPQTAKVVLAVDAVFGWPSQFLALVEGKTPYTPDHRCDERATKNRYLYRGTERFLVERFPMRSNPPMTAIGDKIGNAGTKAQYFINQMRKNHSCYVPPLDKWDQQRAADAALTIVEVYPSAMKFSEDYKNMVKLPDGTAATSLNSGDAADSIRAALGAACYAETVGMIGGGFPRVWLPCDAPADQYDPEAISREGWIFTPI